MLYLFAGHKRKAGLAAELQAKLHDTAVSLDLHEIDMLADFGDDLLSDSSWKTVLQLVESRSFQVLICIPP